MEMFPLPVVVLTNPPTIFTPCPVCAPVPEVPFNVMEPPPLVLIVPPVKEMPLQAPVVPVEEAVIVIVFPEPEVDIFAEPSHPDPAVPPMIELVATIFPAVEKADLELTPGLFVPPVPPIHPEMLEGLPPPIGLLIVDPKVIVPVVPAAQAVPTSTP